VDNEGEKGMNKVFLVGKLSPELDMHYTLNGKAVCSFSLTVNFKTRVREETDAIDCVAWDTLAELIGQVGEGGRRVAIEGRLHTRHLEGDKGQRKKVTEVVVRDVEFLDRPGLVCPE
jgi:single-strand DNA-binding protein